MMDDWVMSDTAAETEPQAQSRTELWARFAADAHAEIALLNAGHDDPDHRAKVREAHERAIARGSDIL